MKWLLTPFALKIGLSLALLSGGWYWHTSAIREAKQLQAAETRTEVLKEKDDQFAMEKQKYEERITDLETSVLQLARQRAASVQRIEVITKQAETERAAVDSKSDADVLLDIRQRLRTAASPTIP